MLSHRLSPVHKLSDDVLAMIFALLAESDPPRRADENRANPYERETTLGWIIATHTCHKWREVGLAHARLWADAITVFPSAVQEVESRIKWAPVVLDLRSYPDAGIYDLLIKNYLLRARIIKDDYPVGSEKEGIWAREALSGQRMHSLEHLELTYIHPIDHKFEGVQYSPLATFVPLDAPILTHAVLTAFISLTAPCLRVLIADKDWIFTLPEITAYLSMLPQLEELTLKLKIIDVPTETATQTPTVHLPHLHSFTNECSDFSIVRLLQRIEIPATTTVECYLGPKDAPDERDERDLHALCQAITSQLHEASRDQLVIDYDSTTHLSVAPRFDPIAPCLDLPLQNGVTLGGGFELRLEGALAIVASEVACSVESLAIRSFRPDELPINFVDLHKSFEKLAGVQELVVHHRAQRIFGALDGAGALFPELKQIVIEGFRMPTEWSENDTHDKRWFEHLCGMLTKRQQAGYATVGALILRGARNRRCEGASRCFALTDEYHLSSLYWKSLVEEVIDERHDPATWINSDLMY